MVIKTLKSDFVKRKLYGLWQLTASQVSIVSGVSMSDSGEKRTKRFISLQIFEPILVAALH